MSASAATPAAGVGVALTMPASTHCANTRSKAWQRSLGNTVWSQKAQHKPTMCPLVRSHDIYPQPMERCTMRYATDRTLANVGVVRLEHTAGAAPVAGCKYTDLHTEATSGSIGLFAARAGPSRVYRLQLLFEIPTSSWEQKQGLCKDALRDGRGRQHPAAQLKSTAGCVVPKTLLYPMWPLPAAGHEAVSEDLASSQCTTKCRQLCCQVPRETQLATNAVASAGVA